jgi:fatty-acyl-CoA synthase
MKVFDWIANHANRTPDKLAQIDWHSQRRFTYAEMNARVARLAGFMRDTLGVQRGDRIAVLTLSNSNVFEIEFACARLGAIFIPLNNRFTAYELEYVIADVGATVLFHSDDFKGMAEELKPVAKIRHFIEMDALGEDSQYEAGLASASPVWEMIDQDVSQTWCVLYTSGTTGHPKGACLTHEMILTHALNCGIPSRLTNSSVNLCFLPLFHTGGLNVYANPVFYTGGTNIVIRSFDTALMLQLISDRELGVSHFLGVPSNYQFMAEHPDFERADFSRVVTPLIGGAPAPISLLERYAKVGMNLQQGFGMTETGPVVLMLDAKDAIRKQGATGKPVMHVEVKLMKDDGTQAGVNEIGEIWLKGPCITPRYWGDHEANKTDFTDGWLHTGDAAIRDEEGYYSIVDRTKNMYISGGENVSPAEVENVICQLTEVLEVAVIGAPHKKWGETGCAFITLKEGKSLTADDVIVHCSKRLARFKVPKAIVFCSELPHNATGKLLKRELRSQAAKAVEDADIS